MCLKRSSIYGGNKSIIIICDYVISELLTVCDNQDLLSSCNLFSHKDALIVSESAGLILL